MTKDFGNKEIFASNLRHYMEQAGITRMELSEDLGIPYMTISDWVNGKKYPRIDKIEILANYFGVLKSDLVEKKDKDINTIAAHALRDLSEEEIEAVITLAKRILNDKEK